MDPTQLSDEELLALYGQAPAAPTAAPPPVSSDLAGMSNTELLEAYKTAPTSNAAADAITHSVYRGNTRYDLRGAGTPLKEIEAQPGDFVVDGRAWRMGDAQNGMTGASPTSETAAQAEARRRAEEMDPTVLTTNQGLMFDYADEIGGMVAGLGTKVENLVHRAKGEEMPYTSAEFSDAMTQALRSEDKNFTQEHPFASGGTRLLGGLLLPGGPAAKAVSRAPSLLSAVGRTAAIGGGMGALQGSGAAEGGVANRAVGAAGGSAAGAALGAVLPVAGMGLAKAGAPVLNAAQRTIAGALGKAAPVVPSITRAERQVGRVIERSIKRDGSTPAAAMAELENLSPETLPMMVAGKNLQSLGEFAAKTPGSAQETLVASAQQAQDAIKAGVKADVGTALGGRGDYLDTLEASVTKRRTDANATMERLASVPVKMDADAVQALRSDMVLGVVKKAAQTYLGSPDPAVRKMGATLNRLSQQVLDAPGDVVLDVRAAQDISYALKQAADGAYRSSDGAAGGVLSDLSKAIRSNARDPARGGAKEYDAWLRKYGDDSEHIEALQTGRAVFNGPGQDYANTAEGLRKTYADLSQTGRDMFRKGVGEALLMRVKENNGGVGMMRRLMKDEEFRDKVKIAFPTEESYNNFVNSVTKRVRADNAYRKMQEGSPTYPMQAVQRDLEADPVGGAIDAFSNVRGAIGGFLKSKAPNRSLIERPETNTLLGNALGDDGGEMLRLLQQLQTQRIAQQGRLGRVNKVGGLLVTPAESARERAMSGAYRP
jgi:hypothetical protein